MSKKTVSQKFNLSALGLGLVDLWAQPRVWGHTYGLPILRLLQINNKICTVQKVA